MENCAIYARVSGEDQNINGQLTELPVYAKKMGWEIYKTYVDDGISGAHVDTRPDFKLLLEDMINQKFQILLVEFHDRITRTDDLAERGLILQTIKENNILLCSPSEGETDLSEFAGEVTSTIKFMIAAQERKRIRERLLKGKVRAAEKNIPPVGQHQLPYGRTYNREANAWGIDEEKRAIIEVAADEYLGGRNLKHIAKEIGMSYEALLYILKDRCGVTWIVGGKKKIPAMEIKIPRLLSDEKIGAIRERTQLNKTLVGTKTDYLFRGTVYCFHCHKNLHGQAQGKNRQFIYYRHHSGHACGAFNAVNENTFREGVIGDLLQLTGNKEAVERAVDRAYPNADEVRKLKRKLTGLNKNIESVGKGKSRIVESISKGIITDSDAAGEMDKLREREKLLTEDIRTLDDKIRTLPDPDIIKKHSQYLRRMLKGKLKNSDYPEKMSFKEKRDLLETVFTGKDADGIKFGIYIKSDKGDYILHMGYKQNKGETFFLPPHFSKSSFSGFLFGLFQFCFYFMFQ